VSGLNNKGLGRGLGALLTNTEIINEEIKGSIVELKINDIAPNADQPRKQFDQDKLQELAASIREMGLSSRSLFAKPKKGIKSSLVNGVGELPAWPDCQSFPQLSAI